MRILTTVVAGVIGISLLSQQVQALTIGRVDITGRASFSSSPLALNNSTWGEVGVAEGIFSSLLTAANTSSSGYGSSVTFVNNLPISWDNLTHTYSGGVLLWTTTEGVSFTVTDAVGSMNSGLWGISGNGYFSIGSTTYAGYFNIGAISSDNSYDGDFRAVPDGGVTLVLLGCALMGAEAMRRKVTR